MRCLACANDPSVCSFTSACYYKSQVYGRKGALYTEVHQKYNFPQVYAGKGALHIEVHPKYWNIHRFTREKKMCTLYWGWPDIEIFSKYNRHRAQKWLKWLASLQKLQCQLSETDRSLHRASVQRQQSQRNQHRSTDSTSTTKGHNQARLVAVNFCFCSCASCCMCDISRALLTPLEGSIH